jgi:hypothetical protein
MSCAINICVMKWAIVVIKLVIYVCHKTINSPITLITNYLIILFYLCEIWGSHGVEHEDESLLGYSAV